LIYKIHWWPFLLLQQQEERLLEVEWYFRQWQRSYNHCHQSPPPERESVRSTYHNLWHTYKGTMMKYMFYCWNIIRKTYASVFVWFSVLPSLVVQREGLSFLNQPSWMFNELFVQRNFPSPAAMKNFVSSAVAPATAKFTPGWIFWSLVNAR